MTTVVALDFETATRSPASACALGLAFVEDGRVTDRFYTLIRPRDLAFDPMNIRVHGIRPTDVLDAPEFPEVWAAIRDRLDGALVLAHNAAFDCRVLGATLAAYRVGNPAFRSFCTVSMARRLWPDEPSRRLSALAQKFGIGFRHHHAGEDAFACAQIALEGARQTGAESIQALAGTLGLAKPIAAARAPRAGGIAERALGARAGAPPLENILRFRVAGSKGTPYDMVVRIDGRGERTLFCSCPGARFRPECRHMRMLRDGDHASLIAPGEAERRQLSAVLIEALRPAIAA